MRLAMDEANHSNAVRSERDGSRFRSCPDFCYTDRLEVATFPRANWTSFGRSRGRAVLGRAVPEKGGPGCTEHDETKTLKPTPTRETPLHETVKQAPTPHSTHTRTTPPHTHAQHTTHNTPHSIWPNSIWPKSVWPKSVLAKVGHTTKTPTLAKVGLAKLGRPQGLAKVWPKSDLAKVAIALGFRVSGFQGFRVLGF